MMIDSTILYYHGNMYVQAPFQLFLSVDSYIDIYGSMNGISEFNDNKPTYCLTST